MPKPKPPYVVNVNMLNGYLYIGRGSRWGNPYRIASGLTRTMALKRYEAWVRKDSRVMDNLHLLTGQALGCPSNCKPKPCHGDVLVKLWKEKFK